MCLIPSLQFIHHPLPTSHLVGVHAQYVCTVLVCTVLLHLGHAKSICSFSAIIRKQIEEFVNDNDIHRILIENTPLTSSWKAVNFQARGPEKLQIDFAWPYMYYIPSMQFSYHPLPTLHPPTLQVRD